MKNVLFLLLAFALLFTTCKTDNEPEPEGSKNYTFSGVAQKGPLLKGAKVTVNELNEDLGQTGRTFTTTISSDKGDFRLENIELNSSIVQVTAEGFYFSETYGRLSPAKLSLQSITDLNGKQTANVNVFTHIIKGRIENLIKNGMSFQDASGQAKTELLNFLGISEEFNQDIDEVNLVENTDEAGALLAFSIILQRWTGFMHEQAAIPAEVSSLLWSLNNDFKDDGIINDQKLINQLLNNIGTLGLNWVRQNIERRYKFLGLTDSIPDFETYIAKFQFANDPNLYTDFFYPDSALVEPEIAPDSYLTNLLVPEDILFKPGAYYALAAYTPVYSTLKIKFYSDSDFELGAPAYGWDMTGNPNTGYILQSINENVLMTTRILLDTPGTATIEYYENETETPTFTKEIRWGY